MKATILDVQIADELERHEDRMRAFRNAREILARYELTDLLEQATYFHVFEDSLRDADGRQYPADRYWITLRFPQSRKAELRPIILQCIHRWEKGYRVDHGVFGGGEPLLVESWQCELDRLENRYWSRAYNRIEIDFTSPASEGTRLSPTCAIATVENHTAARTESRLAVVCQKA